MDRGRQPARLVGRTTELARLAGMVRDRREGVVVVSGEPGIGKSRLLREFAALAEQDGWLVAQGRATEFERELPFGVFTDAIDDLLPAIEPGRLAAVGADRLALLGELFLGLPAGTGDGRRTGLTDVERYRLYRAVRVLLEVLARPSGLVLILDDAHWADE